MSDQHPVVPAPPGDATDLMTSADVRAYFGGNGKPISEKTLKRLIDTGTIPQPILFTSLRRWRRKDIVEAVNKLVERGGKWPS